MTPSLAGALLESLGLGPAGTPVLVPPPLLTWPSGSWTVSQGSVQTTAGGWDRTTSPNPRVVIAAGPEVTLRGVGAAVQAWLAAMPAPSGPLPDATTTTQAIVAYTAVALGIPAAVGAGSGVVAQPLPAWSVGALVAVPIECTASGTPAPVVNMALLTQLAAAYDPAWDGLLDLVAAPLAFPDAAADASAAAATLAGVGSVTDACASLRRRLLANPSQAISGTLALLAAIDARGAVDVATFATTLVTQTLAADELALLATLIPGAVVLRALYRRLVAAGSATPGVTAAIDALNGALGFQIGTSADLTQTGGTVVGSECAVSTAWRMRPAGTHHGVDANGEPTGGWHELVLGRAVYCGPIASFPGTFAFTGPAYVGTKGWDAPTMIAANEAQLNPAANAGLDARLDVVGKVAANEGFVDAARLADRGLLSLGIQQWSAHHDDELSILLFKLCASDPDAYDAHFGVYGLGLNPMPDSSGQVPSSVGLNKIPAGGTAQALAPAPDNDSAVALDRLTFFGGYPVDAHHFTFVDPADETVRTPWAARVRSAARSSHALTLTEISHAASRFDRIALEHPQVTVGATTFALSAVVTSRRGAGQLIDQHINHPDGVAASLNAAVHYAPPLTTTAGAPSTAWVQTFEALYQQYVTYGSSTLKQARVNHINSAGLDATPGSFAAGWAYTP